MPFNTISDFALSLNKRKYILYEENAEKFFAIADYQEEHMNYKSGTTERPCFVKKVPQNGYSADSDGLKNILFYFVVTVMTEMACRGALNDYFVEFVIAGASYQ